MKIKCVRYPCQVCSKLASIQLFYSKSGDIKYARARHCTGTQNGKPQFQYHIQNVDVLKTLLKTQSISLTTEKAQSGQVGQAKHIDLLNPENSLNQQNSRGCRLAWSRLVDLGSLNWSGFSKYVEAKYAKSYAYTIMEYSVKYHSYFEDVNQI
jgi:hypothetical protein